MEFSRQENWSADHLTCLLRNLYAGQETTVRTEHGPTDWFQIGKGVHQACILSPCLFKLYTEYIMWNASLDEAQAGVKIAGRNINNLRYLHVSSTKFCWDTSTLIFSKETQLPHLSEIHSWLLLLIIIIINFLRKVLKVKISSPLYHWVMTKSFPQSSLRVSYQ